MRGTRYVMPGDFATVEADGSITLLGRGSIVINSGGEKIFPEEVESAVRSHPDVMDAIVCGAPDERWGQTVAAIIQPRVGPRGPLARRASRSTAAAPSPATSCPVASTSWTRSSAHRAGSPTTPGPRPSWPRARRRPPVPLELTDLLAGRALGGMHSGLPAAVLTMELQRGVMGDLATFPELAAAAQARGIVDQAARLLARFRQANLPVVHCTAEFRADRAGTVVNTPLHSAVLRRPEHMLEGTPAVELVPALGPRVSDYVSARRHGVSPFTGTPLHTTLQGLGVRVLVVTGVSVNVAVFGLCIEAVNLGYQVVVASDAVAGVPLDYADAVMANSLSLVAAVHTVDAIVEALDVLTR